jgi:lipoprotein-releasing system ATP-binding protein
MNNIVLEARNITKCFHDGSFRLEVLKSVSFSIQRNSLVAISGASGSGKSTLLHILGGLDQSDAGEIYIEGELFSALSEKRQCRLRNQRLGFIYQFHHLLPEFTAEENVAMPLLLANMPRKQAMMQANACLSSVGLKNRTHHKPSELSGGERQRVAIARALVTRPACVLADEPTGNLDRENAENVFSLMKYLCDEYHCSFLIVTHDSNIAAQCDKQLVLVNGVLQ